MLAVLDYSDFDLGILICGEKMMRDYNRTYRGKDKVTDVLFRSIKDVTQSNGFK